MMFACEIWCRPAIVVAAVKSIVGLLMLREPANTIFTSTNIEVVWILLVTFQKVSVNLGSNI